MKKKTATEYTHKEMGRESMFITIKTKHKERQQEWKRGTKKQNIQKKNEHNGISPSLSLII